MDPAEEVALDPEQRSDAARKAVMVRWERFYRLNPGKRPKAKARHAK